jgi:hypothetical protein
MADTGWNTAIIKDRAKEMGINLSDAVANEVLKNTFVQSMYGADPNKVMLLLQGMKGGGGDSGTTTAGSTSDFATQYVNILNQLKSSGQFDTNVDVSGLSEQIKSGYEELAKKTEQQIPLISQIYEQAAKSLQQQKEYETGLEQERGTREAGTQKAALASEGVSAATGAAYAPIQEVERATDERLRQVADKYNLKEDQLRTEMTKSISDLTLEANKYRQAGLDSVADLTLKAAQLKQQEDAIIRQMASDILVAQNDTEKNLLKQQYQDQLLTLKQQQIDNYATIQLQKVALESQGIDIKSAQLGIQEDKLQLEKEKDPLLEKISEEVVSSMFK